MHPIRMDSLSRPVPKDCTKCNVGLTPVATWSGHHLRHTGLAKRSAVHRAVEEERRHIASEIDWLREKTPFHRI